MSFIKGRNGYRPLSPKVCVPAPKQEGFYTGPFPTPESVAYSKAIEDYLAGKISLEACMANMAQRTVLS